MTAPLRIEVAAAMRGKEIAAESLATTTKREAPKNGIAAKEGIDVVILESMV
jgi:hypothetical protein